MTEKNLHVWARELIESPDFQNQFQQDPFTALENQGFQLDESYRRQLNTLSQEEREKLLQVFTKIANSSPEQLRQIYAEYAESYERFFGWEGRENESLRNWI